MPLSDRLDEGRRRDKRTVDVAADTGLPHGVAARAVALHNLHRLRMRHFISPVMADPAMSVMLTLYISECQEMTAGEQAVLLANQIAISKGVALVDTLVQAGLVVATGEKPGQRSVGLTPLGSARMRAYIIDSTELM